MYEIRPMEERDCRAVYELEQRCFFGSTVWKLKDILNVLKYENNLYLVCEAEGAIVGCIGLMRAADEGDITNVFVAPEYRRQKIAASLMQEILRKAARGRVRRLFLEVRKSNIPAISLYEKYGFSKIGCRKNYYDSPKEDALIMKVQTDCFLQKFPL